MKISNIIFVILAVALTGAIATPRRLLEVRQADQEEEPGHDHNIQPPQAHSSAYHAQYRLQAHLQQLEDTRRVLAISIAKGKHFREDAPLMKKLHRAAGNEALKNGDTQLAYHHYHLESLMHQGSEADRPEIAIPLAKEATTEVDKATAHVAERMAAVHTALADEANHGGNYALGGEHRATAHTALAYAAAKRGNHRLAIGHLASAHTEASLAAMHRGNHELAELHAEASNHFTQAAQVQETDRATYYHHMELAHTAAAKAATHVEKHQLAAYHAEAALHFSQASAGIRHGDHGFAAHHETQGHMAALRAGAFVTMVMR